VSPPRAPEPLAEVSILTDGRKSVMIGNHEKRNPIYACPRRSSSMCATLFPGKRTHIVK
jgi:hypothetical protein